MSTPKTEPLTPSKEDVLGIEREEDVAGGKVDEEPNEVVIDQQGETPPRKSSGRVGSKRANNVRKLRMERMMSKAELARRAGLSTLTIDRVERGMACRMDTKRKILEALGLTPSDRMTVFGEDD
jgi:DNA-binding XRE family transcriptional regulator